MFAGLRLEGRRKNGDTFRAEIALTPIEEGPELLVASTIRDVSAVDASEEYFRHLLDAAPDAMIIVDERGRIAIANDQSERMFGYAREDLVGKPIETLLPQSVRRRHVRHREEYGRDPRLRPMGSGMALYARRADGSEFPVEISLSPVRGASGSFVSSVIRDVTERKTMEAALIAARHEAERAHKANTAFLAAASHDLRQPVQALSLLNGALRRTVSDPLAKDMVTSQQQSLDAMTNLLNSLLDISRLDAGAIQPELEEFPARRLVDRLSAEFARQARQKQLRFSAERHDATIRSDPNLLAEIIQNLVSNAIRYTERGDVTMRCREEGDALCIDVIDTGIGIPPEQLEDIFREFHQLKSPGGRTEGFGLGLAIVRRLADLLGHEIRVESEPGKGSCFTVVAPAGNGAVAGGRAHGHAGMPARRRWPRRASCCWSRTIATSRPPGRCCCARRATACCSPRRPARRRTWSWSWRSRPT
ncbi:MAG: PAS domain-containing sensor histidine kinase [Woeseiaceae bacterium]|nr:PAS domain-containing sensor histidine kinase [Woeseiaceae bacterium]